MQALADLKEKIKTMKAAGQDVGAEVVELKRLKTLCGEVELTKAEKKKLEKEKKAALAAAK